jgi:rRNA processing protein Gar1
MKRAPKMNVSEIIAKLQTMPPNMEVVVLNDDLEDEGFVTEIIGPNEEMPNAVYLVRKEFA